MFLELGSGLCIRRSGVKVGMISSEVMVAAVLWREDDPLLLKSCLNPYTSYNPYRN